ncbi:hypothetical protein COU19_02225 [Candidatus Kaiserbacteria bacterium CG10_big_fil_rev_8_21_14_0_10_56_12]|uniref:Uncharacterized protein n=1 Tax=Candidatus Kaiserbacteria bacterium CG10_big_fil_rev_8_21_14_0_10_56_12 TaxID=1974611 RepID=A0A2H0U9M0_9BACT|nr:MAG: hypothetical protein COU19_02225 [Candidatus Kaiserbacteria bacterium CG10_big_fil_rev_8_21_14_0_10_56_12]
MTNNSAIERVVMRRVHRLRILRAILSTSTLVLGVFVLALWDLGKEVWVAKVLTNGPQDTLGHALYFVYAFEHTRLLVQALTLVTLVSVVYLARVTARLLTNSLVSAARVA